MTVQCEALLNWHRSTRTGVCVQCILQSIRLKCNKFSPATHIQWACALLCKPLLHAILWNVQLWTFAFVNCEFNLTDLCIDKIFQSLNFFFWEPKHKSKCINKKRTLFSICSGGLFQIYFKSIKTNNSHNGQLDTKYIFWLKIKPLMFRRCMAYIFHF